MTTKFTKELLDTVMVDNNIFGRVALTVLSRAMSERAIEEVKTAAGVKDFDELTNESATAALLATLVMLGLKIEVEQNFAVAYSALAGNAGLRAEAIDKATQIIEEVFDEESDVVMHCRKVRETTNESHFWASLFSVLATVFILISGAQSGVGAEYIQSAMASYKEEVTKLATFKLFTHATEAVQE